MWVDARTTEGKDAKMAGGNIKKRENPGKRKGKGVTLLSTCFTSSRERVWQTKEKENSERKEWTC